MNDHAPRADELQGAHVAIALFCVHEVSAVMMTWSAERIRLRHARLLSACMTSQPPTPITTAFRMTSERKINVSVTVTRFCPNLLIK
jgi:hypothetical protein